MYDDAEETVSQCNALAKLFYKMHGCEVPEGYRFDKAKHPQERSMWNLAVTAYYFIDGVDVEEARKSLRKAI